MKMVTPTPCKMDQIAPANLSLQTQKTMPRHLFRRRTRLFTRQEVVSAGDEFVGLRGVRDHTVDSSNAERSTTSFESKMKSQHFPWRPVESQRSLFDGGSSSSSEQALRKFHCSCATPVDRTPEAQSLRSKIPAIAIYGCSGQPAVTDPIMGPKGLGSPASIGTP